MQLFLWAIDQNTTIAGGKRGEKSSRARGRGSECTLQRVCAFARGCGMRLCMHSFQWKSWSSSVLLCSARSKVGMRVHVYVCVVLVYVGLESLLHYICTISTQCLYLHILTSVLSRYVYARKTAVAIMLADVAKQLNLRCSCALYSEPI